jgi:hypothetical protein
MTHAGRCITLPDGRVAIEVPADEAGEAYLSAAEGLLAHLRIQGVLTGRQCDAAAELSRLYGIGGGRSPWRMPGAGMGRADDEVANARVLFNELLASAPHRTQWAITVLCMGEWPTSRDPRPLWREGLDAVADRMKMPRDDA